MMFAAASRAIDKLRDFYIRGNLDLLRGKKSENVWGRCRLVCADPSNKYIPRVKDAGKIADGYVVMHNGIKCLMGEFSYYGDFADIVLSTNKGVHEPQEERMFMDVLKFMPEGATMIELGSYWAFYSMWFKKSVKNARCFMIEPEIETLRSGQENFKFNGLQGTFIRGKIAPDGIKMDAFFKEKGIDTVHLLHSDIQGAEWEMLESCKEAIAAKKIHYFFISTHSQKLHWDCLEFLEKNGYVILASADFENGTYCYDGILVARLKSIPGLEPVNLPLRRPNVFLDGTRSK